jgi:hypothetical protein
MKNIKILFFILFAYFSSNAQDPQLFENTWYLQNLIIDGQDNFPPSNEEVPFITVFFSETQFETYVCDVMSGGITYDDINSQFTLDVGLTFDGCQMSVNGDFQLIYLNNFYENNVTEPFSYSITNESSNKILIIINDSGNEAIYSSELLSTIDFSKTHISIYPNPVKGEFFISEMDSEFSIKIFDINGKLVLKRDNINSNKPIEVEKLNNGIYFILLKDNQGRSVIKKFIKN